LKTSDYFSNPSWQPLSAVGSHGPGGVLNAQICISISSASIVPEKPRLLVVLWKQNYTHDLVLASGSLCISVLDRERLDAFEALGLETGRRGPKLDGIDVRRTRAGDPYLAGCVGYADCMVGDRMDLGDCSMFLVYVQHEERLSESEPITWGEASELLPEAVLRRYQAKLEGDRAAASAAMRWLT
jgi:flavin reductase (DIM6/NTAB) family NADH-FMN oxidoreductase RutF